MFVGYKKYKGWYSKFEKELIKIYRIEKDDIWN